MNQGLEGRTERIGDDPDADTIELELTPEQVLALSHGAHAIADRADAPDATPAVAPAVASPTKPRTQSGGTTRFRFWPLALIAAVLGATVWLTWWMAAPHVAPHDPPELAVGPPAPARVVVAPDPPPPPPAGPPVRVKNPFDAREVFEFPPGTTKAEARQAVADLLMQRALERRAPPVAVTQAGGQRSTRGAQ